MDSLYNFVINNTLKSEMFKAFVLANVRHVITGGGVWLVQNGYATNSMVEQAMGLALTIASFYLANLDVKLVDGKIKVALNTPAPTVPVQTEILPPVQDTQK